MAELKIKVTHAAFKDALNCPNATDLNAQLTLNDRKFPGLEMQLGQGDMKGYLVASYKGKKILCPQGNIKTLTIA